MDFNTFYNSVWNIEYIVQILVAEAMCCFCFKRRRHFEVRAVIAVIACVAFYMLARWADGVIEAYQAPRFLYVFKMFLTFFVTIIAMKVCFDESIWSVLFAASAAQLMQHLAFEVASMFMDICGIPWNAAGYICTHLFTFAAVYVAIYFLLLRKMESKQFSNIGNKRMIFVTIVCTLICFTLSWYGQRFFTAEAAVVFRSTLVVVCFILLAYQFSFLDNSTVIQQNKQLQQMLLESQERYAMADEKREIINIKCHDIKKQLREYGERLRIDGAAMNEMLEAVNIYDTSMHTGNDALDVILSDKALHCERHNIQFGAIVDGAACSFLPPMDLYALFGNILDNAIEAVKQLKQREKAVINLNVRTEGKLLIIHCENYFNGTLQFADGLPLSTKHDDDYHGFGMKSIRLVAEKYGGTLSVSVDKDVFAVNVILPVREKKQKAWPFAPKKQGAGPGDPPPADAKTE